jgi:hypothetical protein
MTVRRPSPLHGCRGARDLEALRAFASRRGALSGHFSIFSFIAPARGSFFVGRSRSAAAVLVFGFFASAAPVLFWLFAFMMIRSSGNAFTLLITISPLSRHATDGRCFAGWGSLEWRRGGAFPGVNTYCGDSGDSDRRFRACRPRSPAFPCRAFGSFYSRVSLMGRRAIEVRSGTRGTRGLGRSEGNLRGARRREPRESR